MRFKTKHGMKGTKEYNSWRGMKNRCNHPSHKFYHNYGGRGIKVCDTWNNDFTQFFKDMGSCPIGYTLDRIDNNGNYEPGNCRWASRQTQTLNSRKQKGTASQYKGVTFMKDRQKWKATLRRDKTETHLGFFINELDAAIAYQKAAIEYENSK